MDCGCIGIGFDFFTQHNRVFDNSTNTKEVIAVEIFVIGAVTLIATLTIALIGFESTTPSKEGTKTQEVTLKIDGITCKMCLYTIKSALKKLDGVSDADVSFKDKEAKVKYDGDKVTVDQMLNTVESADKYKAVIIDKEGKEERRQ